MSINIDLTMFCLESGLQPVLPHLALLLGLPRDSGAALSPAFLIFLLTWG